jgi:hypothetical protein
MVVERYPNFKEEVGSSIPGFETSSLPEEKTCQVVNCVMCFDPDMSTICPTPKTKNKKQKTKKERKKEKEDDLMK